jgi:hypothetical protein
MFFSAITYLHGPELQKCAEFFRMYARTSRNHALLEEREWMRRGFFFKGVAEFVRGWQKTLFSHLRLGLRDKLRSAAPINVFSEARLPSQLIAKPFGVPSGRKGLARAW